MSTADALAEFRSAWLPHVTDDGLNRLIDLLEKASPLLIHGTFARVPPMGCLASHVAWNHPKTCRHDHDAGIVWLAKVAGLNPATSALILAWDRYGAGDFQLRSDLLAACREERSARRCGPPCSRLADYADALS